MLILVTNDDGILSDGLRVLVSELATRHEVWIFAPDGERSGVSHAMTLKQPVLVRKVAEREFSCSGTPADCIILAELGVVPVVPDVVVSGINRGPNMGTDLVYSGTAAAARQAALYGIPAIAVSLATYVPPFDYIPSARFIVERLAALMDLWKPGTFINVNVPPVSRERNIEAVFAVPGHRTYQDNLTAFDAPDGYKYCFLSGGHVKDEEDQGTDSQAVSVGKAAVSRIIVSPQVSPDFTPGPFPGTVR
ncbi:MAG: 5'/3'-nucleotidase SurE [Spirochaetes bacterium]|nr:5'/3'-nucleotidase SurE [Spirochaetota bacterium]